MIVKTIKEAKYCYER